MLIVQEAMQLLVNSQLVPTTMQPKSISFEQICHKRSQGIVVTSLHSLHFRLEKQRPKTNLEKCYQFGATIEISLDLKVFFP